MVKSTPSNDEVDRCLREIPRQRDRFWRSIPALSQQRQIELRTELAWEVPVEVAMRKIIGRRDGLRTNLFPEIPVDVMDALREKLRAPGPHPRAGNIVRQLQAFAGAGWLHFPSAAHLAAAACLLVTIAFVAQRTFLREPALGFSPKRAPSAVGFSPVKSGWVDSPTQFRLRVNPAELASELSLVASHRTLAIDDPDGLTRLRLDLPVRAFLNSDEVVLRP